MSRLPTLLLVLGCLFWLGACSPKELTDPNAGKADKSKKADKKAPAKNPYASMVPQEIGKHDQAVTHVAFSRDGKMLVSTGKDKLIKLWQPDSATLLKTLSGHTGPVMMAEFSPDGTRLVSASADETARLWDVATGKQLAVLKEKAPKRKKKLTEEEEAALAALPPPQVNWAAFSGDGTRVITASDDFALRMWDAKSGKLISKWSDDGCRQRRVYQRQDASGWITSAGCMDDGVAYLKFWSEEGSLVGTYGSEERDAHYLAFDKQKRFLVTADGSMAMSVYSAQGSFLKRLLVGGYHFCLTFGPADETLLIGTDGGQIFVFKVDGWTRVGKLDLGERVAVDALALSPADDSLAVAARNGKVLRFAQAVKLGAGE